MCNLVSRLKEKTNIPKVWNGIMKRESDLVLSEMEKGKKIHNDNYIICNILQYWHCDKIKTAEWAEDVA
jgi:hypothetical protein